MLPFFIGFDVVLVVDGLLLLDDVVVVVVAALLLELLELLLLVFDVDTDVDVIASMGVVVAVVFVVGSCVVRVVLFARGPVVCFVMGTNFCVDGNVDVRGRSESTTPIGPSKSTSDSGHVSSSAAIE